MLSVLLSFMDPSVVINPPTSFPFADNYCVGYIDDSKLDLACEVILNSMGLKVAFFTIAVIFQLFLLVRLLCVNSN